MKEMTEAEMIVALEAKGYFVSATASILIGERRVPKPVMDPPPPGARYWCVGLDKHVMFNTFIWCGNDDDKRMLRRGMLHLSSDCASQHALALIRASGGRM